MEFHDYIAPVYTCEECLVEREFAGQLVELPLTFQVNKKGEPVLFGSHDVKVELRPVCVAAFAEWN